MLERIDSALTTVRIQRVLITNLANSKNQNLFLAEYSYLVNIVNLIGNVLETVHEFIVSFFFDFLERLFRFFRSIPSGIEFPVRFLQPFSRLIQLLHRLHKTMANINTTSYHFIENLLHTYPEVRSLNFLQSHRKIVDHFSQL